MTEKELTEKYNLQNCSVTYSNEPNMELMTRAFMDYQRKLYLEKTRVSNLSPDSSSSLNTP
ncbi:hypothetical protein STFR1_40320 [Bacillus vallismortis]